MRLVRCCISIIPALSSARTRAPRASPLRQEQRRSRPRIGANRGSAPILSDMSSTHRAAWRVLMTHADPR
jgi:hypothetical protein